MTRSLVKLCAIYAALILIVFLFSMHTAHAESGTDEISLDAQGAILIDQRTGKALYQKNADQRLYPASTTKILTALVALENGNLDDTVTVGKEVLMVPWDSSKAFLSEGERLTLRELLKGMLLPSGNDAAETIAVYIARKCSADMSLDETKAIGVFVRMMNERAKQLGANDSSFANPHGYDDEHHYTTPHDLALIAREAMKKEFFREVVATSEYSTGNQAAAGDEGSRGAVQHIWVNSNALINRGSKGYYEYATGVKTGYTAIAGHCVVSSASKGGIDLIAVVMDSTSAGRWDDSKKLLEYGFANFAYYNGADKGGVVTTLRVDNPLSKGDNRLAAISEQDFSGIFKKEEIGKIKKDIVWDGGLISQRDGEGGIKLLSPIKAGDVIGREIFTLDGKVLKEINLRAREGVDKYSVLNNILCFAAGLVFGAAGVMILIGRASRRRKRAGGRTPGGYYSR